MIQIIAYKPRFKEAFRDLNAKWIAENFEMEEADYRVLDNPEQYILKRGGAIVLAVEGERVLGVCALLKLENHTYQYELAKMAVKEEARGKGIGTLVGNAVIEKARQLGAKQLYLESNRKLKSAISLYHKLGFKEVFGIETPYKRCDIQMVLDL